MKDLTHLAFLAAKNHLVLLIKEENDKKLNTNDMHHGMEYMPNQFSDAGYVLDLIDLAASSEVSETEDGGETVNVNDMQITVSKDGNQIRFEGPNFYWTHSGILNVSFAQAN